MSLFEVSLFLHITAVVVGFGSTFAESIAFPVAMKLDPRHLPYVHALQLAINRRFATPALVVVLVTGLYQVDEAGYSFGDAWVSASFLILIVIGGLLGGYFVPTDRRLLAMVQGELDAAGPGPVDAVGGLPAPGARRGDGRRAHRHPARAGDLPDGRQARRLAPAEHVAEQEGAGDQAAEHARVAQPLGDHGAAERAEVERVGGSARLGGAPRLGAGARLGGRRRRARPASAAPGRLRRLLRAALQHRREVLRERLRPAGR